MYFMRPVSLHQFYLLLLSALLPLASVHAETINCTPITNLPYIITVQGVYCLTGNLTTAMSSGIAIEIQANSVTIDLNGYKLGGQAAGMATTASGIAAAGRQNITIKNGTIRGFAYGVQIVANYNTGVEGGGHVLEDLRIDSNTLTGISVQGSGNIIRNNQVVNTGGSTLSGYSVKGIYVSGTDSRVLNNDVIGTNENALGGAGIYLSAAQASVVENNRISHTGNDSGSSSAAQAIHVGASDGVTIVGNRIINRFQSLGSAGIVVWSYGVIARDNLITNLATGIDMSLGSGVYMNNQVTYTYPPAISSAYIGGTPAGVNYP